MNNMHKSYKKTMLTKSITLSFIISGFMIAISLNGCDSTLNKKPANAPTTSIGDAKQSLPEKPAISDTYETANTDSFKSTADGISDVVTANSQFAIDMYQQLNSQKEQTGKNIFFSPYSLSTAVAMLYTTAEGETKQQIGHVFHYPELGALNANSAVLSQQFNQVNPNYKLVTANDLWIDKQLTPLPSFTQTIERYYGGKVTNLDFKGSPSLSRQTINKKIAEHTNQMIPNLLPDGSITVDTVSVLTNAIYFKADWASPFWSSSDRLFYHFDNTATDTKLMYQKGDFAYLEDDKVQVVQLPYKGNELSMLVVLPKSKKASDMDSLINDLSAKQLKQWTDELQEKTVRLTLPKFTLDVGYRMKPLLSAMGMPRAFIPYGEFSMFGGGLDGNLVISDIYHQAVIKVDELGTEAAAATGIVGEAVSMPLEPPVEFTADHPFMFVIQDNKTGAILFMGQVNQP